jgi:carboxylesterase type B
MKYTGRRDHDSNVYMYAYAERVMIFGESSGAGCVSNHLVMPRSRGLFSRAAMESGAFGTWQVVITAVII